MITIYFVSDFTGKLGVSSKNYMAGGVYVYCVYFEKYHSISGTSVRYFRLFTKEKKLMKTKLKRTGSELFHRNFWDVLNLVSFFWMND